jgi:hypothetical protein
MTELLGCDFSSAPSKAKPIVHARGHLKVGVLTVDRLDRISSLDAWQAALADSGPWIGGFDLPFGLPRELVEALGWPTYWLACMQHYASLTRDEIRAQFKAFCDARPAGSKFAHRATDGPAGSSPSMKWVNPPVAFMLHAGVPRLLAAGVSLAGLHVQDTHRVALEAYPGLMARRIIGTRSYKSDDAAKQTHERWAARKDLLTALELGLPATAPASPWPRVRMRAALHDELLADAKGDALDAVLCLLQAAWAQARRDAGDARFGLPPFDPLEGWIVSA